MDKTKRENEEGPSCRFDDNFRVPKNHNTQFPQIHSIKNLLLLFEFLIFIVGDFVSFPDGKLSSSSPSFRPQMSRIPMRKREKRE